MKDLTSPTWIKPKGIRFLLVGILAARLVLLEQPTWKMALLLALAVWCFCCFYYFAFNVIERYVDSSFNFSGLWSFVVYWFQRRNKM